MMPWMKPRKAAGVIIAKKLADGGMVDEHEEGEEVESLVVASEDLLSAIAMKDAKAVAAALKAAFEICDAYPHEEGEHEVEPEEV
jgi:hypothetical protein